VLDHEGWFGAKAVGDFGVVEGWVQVIDGASGPEGFGDLVQDGVVRICGRGRDGDVFVK
jgi:hypothetical protein